MSGIGVKPPKSREERHAERVFGNWREYRSSRGIAYYYNDVTKKNQWEKPTKPEWDDDKATRPNGHRPHHHHHARRDRHNGTIPRPNNATPKNPAKKECYQNDIRKLLKTFKEKPSTRVPPMDTIKDTTSTIPPTSSTVPKNPKKMWIGKNSECETNAKLHSTNNEVPNGPSTSISDSYAQLYKRKRSRIDEFKRAVPELPKLPDISDFEALRPCADPNLIAPEVRNLIQGRRFDYRLYFSIRPFIITYHFLEQNQRQISELLPKKCHLSMKLARTSTDLKHHRAEVRQYHLLLIISHI